MMGSADPSLAAFFRGRGAHFRPHSRGFDLASDRVSFDCLFDLMQFHRRAADLCLANVLRAQPQDGPEPYRRRIAEMGNDGQYRERESKGDLPWVYDPTNPRACQDGVHKGYVARSNVNPMAELAAGQQHMRLAAAYQTALEKLGAQHPDWVVIPSEPWHESE